jgi:HAMP domain-containing protein
MTGLTDELRNNFHAMKAIATTTEPNANTRIQEASGFVKQLSAPIKGKDNQPRPNTFTEWGV